MTIYYNRCIMYVSCKNHNRNKPRNCRYRGLSSFKTCLTKTIILNECDFRFYLMSFMRNTPVGCLSLCWNVNVSRFFIFQISKSMQITLRPCSYCLIYITSKTLAKPKKIKCLPFEFA